MFTTATSVEFSDNPANGNTVMDLVAGDRPGLLSRIGQVFIDQNIDITAAKIMTIGERAEDVFYIERVGGGPLDEVAQGSLREELVARLDDKHA